MASPLRYPPFVTASRWGTTVEQLWTLVQAKRGRYLARYPETDGSGGIVPTFAPRLTNGDVIRLTMAMLAAIGAARTRELFPLWYQYAAAAYGWSPKRDRLTTTSAQRDAFYPDVLLVEFWKSLMSIARTLDAEGVPSARLDLDGEFSDPVFQGEVRAALRDDGAKVAFVMPVPACKRPDGTIGVPRCRRTMKTWPFLCEEWEKCDPVVIKDPVTVVRDKASSAFALVALVALAWVLFDNQERPRRRR